MLLIFVTSAYPQETTDEPNWKKEGNFAFIFSQISFSNWAYVGQNAVVEVTKLQLFANYKNKITAWDNIIDLGYGLSKVQGLILQKIEDITIQL